MRSLAPAVVAVLAFGAAACQSAPATMSSDAPDTGDAVVAALESAAYPIRTDAPLSDTEDLEAFGDMIGDARIASIGEATHSSHEFVAEQHRILRYLVEDKGFRTFAREVSWTTGERLDDYVVHGIGDPGAIMSNELQTFYGVHDTREFLDLVEWMRERNTRAEPGDEVRFLGMDAGFAGLNGFDALDAHVHAQQPDLRPVFDRLRAELAPAPGWGLQQYLADRMSLPVEERRAVATRAESAAAMLQDAGPRPGADPDDHAWAVQRATAIAQVAREFAFDTTTPEGAAEAGRHRDRSMLANITWWEQRTGHKIMVSSFNAHAAYEPIDRGFVPEPLGGLLRDRYGDDLVTAGTSFSTGSFNAEDADGFGRFRVGPPPPEHNGHTLAAVPHAAYLVDLRTVEDPARSWLAEPRPAYSAGNYYDPAENSVDVALGRAYDLLLHIDEVEAADLRKQP